MSNITSQQFLALLTEVFNQDNGIETIRRYSGRGMYGKECIAITGDDLNLFAIGLAVADAARQECGDDEAQLHLWMGDLKWIRCWSAWAGARQVVYWPGMDWEEGMKGCSDGSDDEDDDY